MKIKITLGLSLVVGALALIGGMMNTVTIQKNYKHSSDKVWSQWSKIEGISEFHPDLTKSEIVSETKAGLNTHRLVTTTEGKQILHKVVEYNDSDQQMAFTFEADFLPLKYAICRIDVEKVSEQESVVKFRVDMEPKFGVLGWVLGKLVLEKKLQQGGDNLLGGLEKHLSQNN